MRIVKAEDIRSAVAEGAKRAARELPQDVLCALKDAYEKEKSEAAKGFLSQLIENEAISRRTGLPLCQDTGMCVVFLEIGHECYIEGDVVKAVNEGVREAYGPLRKSVLHPLTRINTGDNTPCILHTFPTEGNKIKITVAPKGFGSENMSRLTMLTPSAGIEGVKRTVIEAVSTAGANPCPPVIVGVGIGGTMEYAALLAKKALLRPVGSHNGDPAACELEGELLEEVNKLGIGAQGVGGTVTALAVNIELYPTHIAGLPVAVNMQCNCARHIEIEL